MHTPLPWRRLTLLLLSSLMFGMFPTGFSLAAPQSSRLHKLIVDNDDLQTQAQLNQVGGELLFSYEAFSLWNVPAAARQSMIGRDSVTTADEFNTIELRNASIDTRGAAPQVPATLRQSKISAAQFWLVQFAGPIKEDWLKELTDAGIEIVSYMPYNAYVVWADGAQLTRLETLARSKPELQWTGAYHPAYRLAPTLKNTKTAATNTLVPVTVQFYNTPNVKASLQQIEALGGQIFKQPANVLNFVNISLEVPAGELDTLAAWPDVFNVEPWSAPRKLDERQGQIVAGNVTTSGGNLVPSGPGYLNWLASKGFSTNPEDYPIIDVVDDGIDNGTNTPSHPDFYQLGNTANPDRLIYNQNCTTDASADAIGGHGNLNAGIAGAYNNLTGSPNIDSGGYRLDVGISPYTRLAGTKIFTNAGPYNISKCGDTDSGVVAASYNAGAQITSNSWGTGVAGAYDSSSQAYDALTRDASATTPDNQQMLHIFAAGNDGSNATTVGSPGTAKNVLTVGATENVRDEGVLDGCNISASNNANDIATYSSRGPTKDQRAKPDIVAPGSHIQGPASQAPGFDGSGVCGAKGGAAPYNYPAGQTLYTWSSGTSHSTPALAGAASLIYNYYGRVLKPGQTPSPAMLKALMLNTPRYLNGDGSGGSLPGIGQGWGMVDLGQLFDSTQRILVDQTTLFTTTGQAYNVSGTVVDPAKPVRVSLVWTDAPGSTTGNSFVNDLNLSVMINGQQYKGNVFSGATSTSGGSVDSRNNVENVFLPAGTTGTMSVSVTAANLAGNGVPNTGTVTDQDFALVISNAAATPAAVLSQTDVTVDDATGGNNNGIAEPGETVKLTIGVANSGDTNATNVQGTIALTGGAATLGAAASNYPAIPTGSTATNQTAYTLTIDPAQQCGAPISLSHTIRENGNVRFTAPITLPTGFADSAIRSAVNSTDVPKAIPDNNSTGVQSSLTIASSEQVGKLVVRVSITHQFVGDLRLSLISPAGTEVPLVSRRGGAGDNFINTVLDDDAATAISAGSAPFTGTFRPEQPLAAFNDQPLNGTWKLKAVDAASSDAGTITSWSITPYARVYTCNTRISATAGTTQSTIVTRAFPTAFEATARDSSNNPMGNVAVTFVAPESGPSGTFPGGAKSVTVRTDAGGKATAPTFTANGTPGSYLVRVQFSNVQTSAAFNLTNTPATVTANAGTPQLAKLGQTFGAAFQVLVRDTGGNVAPNIAVTLSAPDSGAGGTFPGSAKSVTVTTNTSGIATAPAFTANNIKGSYTVTAQVGNVSTPVFNLTNVGWPATLTASAGHPQVTKIGRPFATRLQVTVRDADGDPVPNETVTFLAPTSGARATFPGGATTATATTNAGGVATAPVLTANTTTGTFVVTANVNPALAGAAAFALTNVVEPIVIAPATLPNPQPGVAYDQTLTATGGTDTGYTFAIADGALPPGLTLSSGGNLSGTPTRAGAYTFVVSVRDSADGFGLQSYTLTVQHQLFIPLTTR